MAVVMLMAVTAGCVAAQENFTDFGAEIVGSAVDLNAASELHDADEAKSMESLLHWAICERLATLQHVSLLASFTNKALYCSCSSQQRSRRAASAS